MPGEFSYRMHGELYQLYLDDTLLGQPMAAVALALDSASGLVLQHGSPELVEAWGIDRRAALRQLDLARANRIVVVAGRIPLDALNRCFRQPGYAAELLAHVRAGSLPQQPTTSQVGPG